ncbi:hypothetical protein ACVR25_000892 [Cronobacter sakazakii]|nr:hypothetical protein [Cronobacter sakazakii]ELY4362549.1 hypothetical protein [Cronobacter sakazakii]ELY4789929.1 hypothetical protein [Cronobacter sakazakii]ELY6236002.1 hypothetical protein [Cronobacter sakazakii]
MKKLVLLFCLTVLSGCSHEQQINKRDDVYNRYYDFITIYNSATLQDAQAKADAFCKTKAFAIPELREKDLQRLQAEKTYLRVDPAGYHFKCTEMEAMRVRGMYGHKPSKTRYEQLSKAQTEELSRKSAEEYELLQRAAKAPGFHSKTETLPDGSIMTRSYGNGVICESIYDASGGYSSCDNVDE